MPSFTPLDCLVSLRNVARDGTESWVPAVADTVDGRVRIHTIGCDLVECNLSRSLMKSLLDRGYIVRGAVKVWRHTGEEMATVAASLLAPLDAKTRGQVEPLVLASLAAISDANLTAWANSFAIERCDVEDLATTVDHLRELFDRVPANVEWAARLLVAMRKNIGGPAGDAKVRAALGALADLRVRLAAQTRPRLVPGSGARKDVGVGARPCATATASAA